MKTSCRDIFVVTLLCSASFLQPGLGREVAVKGGTLQDSAGLGPASVPSFFMSQFRTTRDEWQWVQAWAAQNGYQISRTQAGDRDSDRLPVKNASWYDVLKWCNAKSQMVGLAPVYTVSGATYKRGCFVPDLNAEANGYRLPSLAEWVWAARGGRLSKGCRMNEDNQVEDVAWYDRNMRSSDRTVIKVPNPLGLYDMSGYNSYGKRGEWCWDFGEPQYSTKRVWRANWWDSIAVGWSSSYPIYKYPDPRGHGLGFRTVRKSR
jgi:formylglycine-generating enzyme required for sulfatase activity